jgi:glucokinase
MGSARKSILRSRTQKTPRPIRALGVDLGGTRIKVGMVDQQGRLFNMKKYATRVELGREALIRRVIRIIQRCLSVDADSQNPPAGIGLGAAGMIDVRKGLVLLSPNFPDWHQVPLARLVSEETGLPTFLDNDANAITYGEKWIGAGKDMNNFACLTLGTGVGSGLILDGRLWYGSQGSGPEIGHMTIHPKGRRCSCGNRGCLETLASAGWLVKTASKKRAPGPLIPNSLVGTRATLSSKDFYLMALQGDPFCRGLFEDLGEALGIAIANLIHILSLEGVVLGGGLSRAATIFLPSLQKEFKKRLTLGSPEKIKIRISRLQEKSGVLGAAGIALERLNKG